MIQSVPLFDWSLQKQFVNPKKIYYKFTKDTKLWLLTMDESETIEIDEYEIDIINILEWLLI